MTKSGLWAAATWSLLVGACGGSDDGSGGGGDAALGPRRDARPGPGAGGEITSARDADVPGADTRALVGGAVSDLGRPTADAGLGGAAALDAGGGAGGPAEDATAPDGRAGPPPDAAPEQDMSTPDAAVVVPQEPSRYDLTADFSEIANPNGPWSFRAGDAVVPAYQGGWAFIADQRAWAFSAQDNGFTPAFMRVESNDTGFTDAALGDFVVHSQDDGSGAGFGAARIVFTCPRAGHVDVSGAMWPARDIGRSNTFTLTVAGRDVAMGTFVDGDPWSRAAPLSLADASPAPLAGLAVAAGDEIALELVRTTEYGDAVGVRLSIVVAE